MAVILTIEVYGERAMAGMKFDELSAQERLLAEQVVLNFRELNRACDAAKDGTVWGVCEELALRQGRELMRKTIETSRHLQKVDIEKKDIEKKGVQRGSANAD